MAKKEFDEFLKKQEETERNAFDPEKIKAEWLEDIRLLYDNVESWLADYIDLDKVKISFYPTALFEELIGRYDVEKMQIEVMNKFASLTPVGKILIGARGRVDLEGPAGLVKFVLVGKEASAPKIVFREYSSEEERLKQKELEKPLLQEPIELAWKIATNPPRIKYLELNEDSFFDSLMLVING